MTKPTRKISVKALVADIKTGLTDAALMEKYAVSEQQIQNLFNKLISIRAIKSQDIEMRGQNPPIYQPPTTSEEPTRVPLPVKVAPSQPQQQQPQELSAEDYIKALERMKKSPKDRIGTLASLGAVGLGAAGGVAASTAIAGVAGATSIWGLSTVGSLVGVSVVAATPVGWVIGSAAGAAAIAYGVSKLVRSGGRADAIKEMNIRELQEEIEKRRKDAQKATVTEDKFKDLVESLQLLVKNKHISQAMSTELLAGVQKGTIPYDTAFSNIQKLLAEKRMGG